MQLDEASVRAFQANLRGELILPGDQHYEAARQLYNGMIDRRPRLIARCREVADVVTAVQFAREHDLLLAIAAAVTMVPDWGPAMTGW